jgi:hypothetical protein
MRRSQSVAVLLLGIIVGCAAERVLVVPQARAGTAPQRWEYACVEAIGGDDVTKMANKFGPQGWELAAAIGAARSSEPTWCFKRPLP